MTIIQLEYLLAVADHGSFSVASEHCFVTQPSLSTQVKNLEDSLGVILLNRNEKPICLTAAGEVVAAQARKALSEFYAIEEKVNQMSSLVKGHLVLGVIPTISPYILHKFIPKFMRKYPDVKLEIKEMYTRDIITGLNRNMVDIGLLAGGFTPEKEIIEEKLYDDKFYLYVSKKHALYGRQSVLASDVNVNDLLLLPDGHCLRSQILDLCGAKNNTFDHVRFVSGSIETITRMVDSTGGITIVPQMMTPFIKDNARSQLISFDDNIKAKRDISLAISRNFYKKSIYKAIKEEIITGTEFDCLL